MGSQEYILTTDEEPTFEVRFACGNCGNEWWLSFPPRVRVDESEAMGGVLALSDDCNVLGVNTCDCCGSIRCAVCERTGDVSVTRRRPMEADDA